MAAPGGISVRGLGGNRRGEMQITRFVRNARVTVAEMAETAASRTAALAEGRHILAVQDTTSLRDDGVCHSLNLHAMIAIDAENLALLGLLDARILPRDGTRKDTHRQRPAAEKQSRRWLDGIIKAATLKASGAVRVTAMSDREGDIFEDFACCPKGTDLLVRASHDRALAGGGRLFAAADAAPELGRTCIALPASPGRKAREARLSLRAVTVQIKRPSTCKPDPDPGTTLPDSVSLTLVDAREIDVPEGCTGAHWRLLTTHTVETLEDAIRITGYYRARWIIEQVFRTLKTEGLDVEAVRIEEPEPFSKLCVAATVAAVCVMQMVQDRDGVAQHPMTHAFDPEDQPVMEAVSRSLEGKTGKQKNPHTPGTLAFAAWVCGRLGGWTGYYGKPGPIVIHEGLVQFHAIRRGWLLRQVV